MTEKERGGKVSVFRKTSPSLRYFTCPFLFLSSIHLKDHYSFSASFLWELPPSSPRCYSSLLKAAAVLHLRFLYASAPDLYNIYTKHKRLFRNLIWTWSPFDFTAPPVLQHWADAEKQANNLTLSSWGSLSVLESFRGSHNRRGPFFLLHLSSTLLFLLSASHQIWSLLPLQDLLQLQGEKLVGWRAIQHGRKSSHDGHIFCTICLQDF